MEQPTFINCRIDLRPACMALFDANCPAYFAPNERAEFADYLNEVGPHYAVALDGSQAVAAFALVPGQPGRARLNWIMVAPDRQGSGIGRLMMDEARNRAVTLGAAVIDIAASHLSAPFFSRFGAQEIQRRQHGWGPDMHRVDMQWSVTN